jgi:hypothetical protein
MTVLEWVGILAVMAAWAGVLSTIVITLVNRATARRSEAAQAMEARLMGAVTRAEKAVAEHAEEAKTGQLALAQQVKDIAEQVRDGYVDRREFDVSMRGVRDGMTQLSKDVGGVANRVDVVHNRVDEIMRYVKWREPER